MEASPLSGRVAARRLSLLLAAGLVSSAGFASVVTGCDDTVDLAPADAGTEAAAPGDAATPADGAAADAAPSDAGVDASLEARGKYLVDHVAACGDCHTPRLPAGAPDLSRYLGGAECFVDVNGPADGGCLHTRNLTNDVTGLKNRTDAQIKTMFLDGQRPDGKNLSPVMPYWVFHNMTTKDADAIVAYLRTVPAVSHQVPVNDPPFADVPTAATPIDPATIPGADGGSASNGRYLASMAGVCIECHTPELAPGSIRPSDMSRPFAGGRAFPAAGFGLPTPPFPETIYSANLTSHATGLAGWTAADVVRVLKQGKDRDDAGVCPPMPVGPMGAFGGLTDQDALDIANYVLGLPPIDNAVPNGCAAP